ncbi:hypothetical protein HMPREF0372_01225 [Flavonifractor plautii ATCC 29863]|uniref:Uncharacterized protein n=1 Tax=Flavonifractor plautii ATCC 29863 TaxID=411475 RepID=G9YP15_FLAPL|nr:hypothetical protein HMPREF0372_01225 [Flavonifractor plautii ATCC 29863]
MLFNLHASFGNQYAHFLSFSILYYSYMFFKHYFHYRCRRPAR